MTLPNDPQVQVTFDVPANYPVITTPKAVYLKLTNEQVLQVLVYVMQDEGGEKGGERGKVMGMKEKDSDKED